MRWNNNNTINDPVKNDSSAGKATSRSSNSRVARSIAIGSRPRMNRLHLRGARSSRSSDPETISGPSTSKEIGRVSEENVVEPVDEVLRKSSSEEDMPPLCDLDEPTEKSDGEHISDMPLSPKQSDLNQRIANFTESTVDDLIAQANEQGDSSYSELRKAIGEVFCNSDALSRAFRSMWSHNENESPEGSPIAVDYASLKRTFEKLFALPDRPFMHALCNAVNHLCDNLTLDLKYQGLFTRDPSCINIFVILLELPVSDANEYFDSAFGNFCKAAAVLPTRAQAILCRFWAEKDSPDGLKSKLLSLQNFISLRVAITGYSSSSPMQDDVSLTSAARVLKLVYYTSLYGGWLDAKDCEYERSGLLSPVPASDMADSWHGSVEGDTTPPWLATPGRGVDERCRDGLRRALNVRALTVCKPWIPYEEFYNEVLSDTIEMDVDFMNFKMLSAYSYDDDENKFSFMLCVPFMLTPACKMKGFWFDNRIRMYSERRNAAVHSIVSGEEVTPYLKLRVRRDNVVQEALVHLELVSQESPSDFKKQLFVEFDGEQGVDEGGLSKEFFQLVTAHLFNPDYGMWTYNEDTRLYWFSAQESVQRDEYGLVGILFGIAIYNNIILDVQFPMALYRKLMGKQAALDDLEDVDPTLYRSLKGMLSYEEEDFDEVYCQTFEVSFTDVFGHTHHRELKHGGKSENVTKDNRQEFVFLYVDFLLNGLVRKAFTAFRKGFYQVIGDSPLPWMFRPEEIEELVCGSTHWDFKALEDAADYDNGLSTDHQLIRWFWSVVHEMSDVDKKLLLQFTTGSDRVPVGGLANVRFIISKNGPDSDQLPTSHTCYNVILLPEYVSREKLKDRLMVAIQNCKGFGLQ